MKKIYTLVTIIAASFAMNAQVVISQVYGGGGNNGAVYSYDYVELFNSGSQPVTLTGHSLQYGSAGSTTFGASNIQHLPTITIPAGGYFLIQQAVGNNTSLPALPTPDLIADKTLHNAVLAMGGTSGRLALVNGTAPASGPSDSNVLDFVGYGSTSVQFEGFGPTGDLSNGTAAFRNGEGCSDTNDNAIDFTVAAPAPRNSQTPVNICNASIKENNIDGLNIFPNPANDVLNITSNSTLDKSVQLFDLTGKKVLDVTTVSKINVSTLKAGIYVAKINEAGKTATRKVVIK